MPTNEKEYNGNLFDQLTLLEHIERHIKTGNLEEVQEEVNLLTKRLKESFINNRH